MRIVIPPVSKLNNAEDSAMVQAMYSRDASSVDIHLEKVEQVGSGKFMEQFYVGYGHASIGQCGNCQPIFIEQVSMLAAKAIQDTPLYNGQESSSRYIDWSTAPFYIPDIVHSVDIISEADKDLFENIYYQLRSFYTDTMPDLINVLTQKYPQKEGEKDAVYERAIKARAFDILRGYLPAGAMTQLSWQTHLHHAHERLLMLFNHPLVEIKDIAKEIYDKLSVMYPHSFKQMNYYYASEEAVFIRDAYYSYFYKPYTTLRFFQPLIEISQMRHRYSKYKEFIESMPRGLMKLPKEVEAALGTVRVRGNIDFGSFRDLQRHRNAINVMPLLSTGLGFHNWYIEALESENLKEKAKKVIEEVTNLYQLFSVGLKIENTQYALPMGFNVEYDVTCNWSELIYLPSLRSNPTVHPTLRQQVQLWAEEIFGETGINLPHMNFDPDPWNIRRGEQTIIAKQ